MTDYLWHKVSEKEKQEISTQSKKIMDNFAKALVGVEQEAEIEDKDEPLKKVPKTKEKESTRQEGEGQDSNKEFRKITLENAPNKDEDFIIAEKKKW